MFFLNCLAIPISTLKPANWTANFTAKKIFFHLLHNCDIWNSKCYGLYNTSSWSANYAVKTLLLIRRIALTWS